MATKQETIEEILAQLGDLDVRTRKMFGEYALYCDEKTVAFVCDDQLFMKITDAGLDLVDDPEFAPAYPGSKDYLLIDRDSWYEADKLKDIVQATADALPPPKPKKKKGKQ